MCTSVLATFISILWLRLIIFFACKKNLIKTRRRIKWQKKIENFIDNIIEEKKVEFKGLIGKENRVENMIEDLKTLNLSNDKLEEVIKVAKKHI